MRNERIGEDREKLEPYPVFKIFYYVYRPTMWSVNANRKKTTMKQKTKTLILR